MIVFLSVVQLTVIVAIKGDMVSLIRLEVFASEEILHLGKVIFESLLLSSELFGRVLDVPLQRDGLLPILLCNKW